MNTVQKLFRHRVVAVALATTIMMVLAVSASAATRDWAPCESASNCVAGAGSSGEHSREIAPVTDFNTGDPIPGAHSKLMRERDAITTLLYSPALQPGHGVTLWWVLFNNPDACVAGNAPVRCGADDLLPFNPDTQAGGTVSFADGEWVTSAGRQVFVARITQGNADEDPLWNALGADVHLILRDHGPPQSGLEEAQITSFSGGCTEASVPPPLLDAPYGDFPCAYVQASVYETQ